MNRWGRLQAPAVLFFIFGTLLLVLIALFVPQNALGGSPAFQATSRSPSAIGYVAFYDLLRRLELPVTRSRGDFKKLIGKTGTLVLVEPNVSLLSEKEKTDLSQIPRVLLVLPKWEGERHPKRHRWVSNVRALPLFSIDDVFPLLSIEGAMDLVRVPTPTDWSTNRIGITPQLRGLVQLIAHPTKKGDIRPLVANSQGILVAEYIKGKRSVWVVSDPDLLNNYGLFKGENGLFAVTLLQQLRLIHNGKSDAPIVFDETAHGERGGSLFPIRQLLRPPFLPVTLLLLLSVCVWIWAGFQRFGAPDSRGEEMDFGKLKLLENSAHLLDASGHQGAVLKRYVRMTLLVAAEPFSLGENKDAHQLALALDHIAKTRGISKSCVEILRRSESIDERKHKKIPLLLQCARDIYLWKVELLDESAANRNSYRNRS